MNDPASLVFVLFILIIIVSLAIAYLDTGYYGTDKPYVEPPPPEERQED